MEEFRSEKEQEVYEFLRYLYGRNHALSGIGLIGKGGAKTEPGNKAGFHIFKRISQKPEVIEDIPATDRATEVDLEKKKFPITKTLGEIKKCIRRVSPNEPTPTSEWLFPHFPVVRPDRSTSKIMEKAVNVQLQR